MKSKLFKSIYNLSKFLFLIPFLWLNLVSGQVSKIYSNSKDLVRVNLKFSSDTLSYKKNEQDGFKMYVTLTNVGIDTLYASNLLNLIQSLDAYSVLLEGDALLSFDIEKWFQGSKRGYWTYAKEEVSFNGMYIMDSPENKFIVLLPTESYTYTYRLANHIRFSKGKYQLKALLGVKTSANSFITLISNETILNVTE